MRVVRGRHRPRGEGRRRVPQGPHPPPPMAACQLAFLGLEPDETAIRVEALQETDHLVPIQGRGVSRIALLGLEGLLDRQLDRYPRFNERVGLVRLVVVGFTRLNSLRDLPAWVSQAVALAQRAPKLEELVPLLGVVGQLLATARVQHHRSTSTILWPCHVAERASHVCRLIVIDGLATQARTPLGFRCRSPTVPSTLSPTQSKLQHESRRRPRSEPESLSRSGRLNRLSSPLRHRPARWSASMSRWTLQSTGSRPSRSPTPSLPRQRGSDRTAVQGGSPSGTRRGSVSVAHQTRRLGAAPAVRGGRSHLGA